jgi:fatty acid desaturase
VTDEARERWQRKHRAQRIRAPRVAAAKRAATVLTLVLAVGFGVLALVAGSGWWALGTIVCFYAFLRLRGVRPLEYGDDTGIGSGT